MLTLPLLITVVLLLLVSAFCSVTEGAFLAINKVRLRHLMQRGAPSAKLVYQLLTRLDRLIATLLVSNNIVNVALTVVGTMLFINLLGPQKGPIVAMVTITLLVLVVAEITPKLFAASHADRVAFTVAWPTRWLIAVMHPVVWVLTGLSHALIRLFGGHRLPRSPLVTEEELKVMIEMGREAGVLAEQELRLLQRIFEFSDSVVREVMVPRGEIAAVELASKMEDALDVLVEEGHARIPVYEGSLDRIVGVIYARDLLAMVRHGRLFVLSDLIRPVVAVPESKRVAELLSEFQTTGAQIAIVQDQAGRTAGLVTIEDLLEEIVGEIHEETPSHRAP